MLELLDRIYFRFAEAYRSFRNPQRHSDFYLEGLSDGAENANARILRQFHAYDPHQFENQHFKAGYYYAVSQAKRMMNLVEDHDLD